MKKIRLFLVLLLATTVTLAQADQSNAPATNMIQTIIQNVDSTHQSINHLKDLLQTQKLSDNVLEQAFSNLVKSWKSTQATYMVGEWNEDMIDTPRYIDTYHHGNEKLEVQIARALKSGDNAQTALFKNSFKTINALEILLFNDKNLTPTERDYAIYALSSLDKHIMAIEKSYQEHEDALQSKEDTTLSYLLNALIDSAYKLKEWRIGEPSGLTKKYKDKPDSNRQEYPYSQQSLAAVTAILTAHDTMIGQRSFKNLGSIAMARGASKEIATIRTLISDALHQASILEQQQVYDFSDSRFKTLYKTLGQLNDAYYLSLVPALPAVQAKILDADGD